MTNTDADFEAWFSCLQMVVLDATGVEFTDEDSVRDDYESGKSIYDVSDSIAAEYND